MYLSPRFVLSDVLFLYLSSSERQSSSNSKADDASSHNKAVYCLHHRSSHASRTSPSHAISFRKHRRGHTPKNATQIVSTYSGRARNAGVLCLSWDRVCVLEGPSTCQQASCSYSSAPPSPRFSKTTQYPCLLLRRRALSPTHTTPRSVQAHESSGNSICCSPVLQQQAAGGVCSRVSCIGQLEAKIVTGVAPASAEASFTSSANTNPSGAGASHTFTQRRQAHKQASSQRTATIRLPCRHYILILPYA